MSKVKVEIELPTEIYLYYQLLSDIAQMDVKRFMENVLIATSYKIFTEKVKR